MTKFLLTVFVFGLFSSFAFAEEKSPEQLQEERSDIEGLESQTLTRVVFASGAKHRIGFYVDLNPDCSAVGDVNVRVTKQPEHGTVEITAATNFPNYGKENIRYKCNQQKVKGMQVSYKSAEKYVGHDAHSTYSSSSPPEPPGKFITT